ncbi:MAG: hypothetical protein CO183_02055 [Candidatus Zambryskibacteria bacterium CG_4_9_14_3_um_filter_42_9]|uniref:HTH deoR-type domain-containing protein n=1 Tax=Candidatus Zambryskibacteria bacterium CG22_combo_CG10-13_8_21_14_all_42_17 TaxID=1975118 RepID=A0A2H0BD23_9BACT|nr:MAG: hypothetical protein COX06_02535 [Candidatus Zambryskibacteria bacterium CG22_combo_CG10-13_8_21_14_all_42_17]PJA36708.1 MAG: hypothetical protein CO183_02055 [Candidatus Zambryskibacteria bacterium CG_4_9_14_3_um_filter_42_9]
MSDITTKPEKIASAIYLITSFFNDQEPLKWKLRTLASEFTSLTMSLNDEFFKEREVLILEIKMLVTKMTSLLSVAKNAGLISSTNHDLMQSEFGKYASVLGQSTNISDVLKIEHPRQNVVDQWAQSLASREKNEGNLPSISLAKPNVVRQKPLKEFGAVLVKKTNRQSIIIGLLKRKREVMIKDITPLINGCSEKTIQRELSAMVRSGVLKKDGDKRWSRYSLAPTPISHGK